MRIKSVVTPFILHVPVTGSADRRQHAHHHALGRGRRADRHRRRPDGYGFTGTHAHLPSDQLITRCIATCHAPLLIGEDARDMHRLWHKLARDPALQWVGRAGITTLSLAAIDIALWDLKAKAAQRAAVEAARRPGRATGCGPTTPTSAGSASPTTRWSTAPGARVDEGFTRHQDQGRLERRARPAPARTPCARRSAPTSRWPIDGNGKWDLPTCLRFCRGAEDRRRVLVRRAALVRRREGPCATGARHAHSGGARRAALHAPTRSPSSSPSRPSTGCSPT